MTSSTPGSAEGRPSAEKAPSPETSPSASDSIDDAADPGSQLVGQWAVCAIAAAAARFVPVPLLDDAVRLRATQFAVSRTLRAHGRTYHSDTVEALYAGADAGSAGRFREALRYLRSIPRRVLLFPVRKYAALFGAVKGVPTDVMVVLLLSRSVHRSLAQGRLANPDSAASSASAARKELAREAVQVRLAFDRALRGMDLRLLTGALADGLSQGKGLTTAAVRFARRTFWHADSDDLALNPGGEVEAGAQQVEAVLRQPEIARLLSEFDAKFDTALPRR